MLLNSFAFIPAILSCCLTHSHSCRAWWVTVMPPQNTQSQKNSAIIFLTKIACREKKFCFSTRGEREIMSLHGQRLLNFWCLGSCCLFTFQQKLSCYESRTELKLKTLFCFCRNFIIAIRFFIAMITYRNPSRVVTQIMQKGSFKICFMIHEYFIRSLHRTRNSESDDSHESAR